MDEGVTCISAGKRCTKPPIGISYVSSFLRQKGPQIEVLDITAKSRSKIVSS